MLDNINKIELVDVSNNATSFVPPKKLFIFDLYDCVVAQEFYRSCDKLWRRSWRQK